MSVDAELLTISQVVARLPGARGARRVHPATVVRWITIGCPARNGIRVRLAATRAGSRWLVREPDLQGFFDSLAADPVPTSDQATNRSPVDRRRAAERAAQQLERMGA
jgi:hypothetical protein